MGVFIKPVAYRDATGFFNGLLLSPQISSKRFDHVRSSSDIKFVANWALLIKNLDDKFSITFNRIKRLCANIGLYHVCQRILPVTAAFVCSAIVSALARLRQKIALKLDSNPLSQNCPRPSKGS